MAVRLEIRVPVPVARAGVQWPRVGDAGLRPALFRGGSRGDPRGDRGLPVGGTGDLDPPPLALRQGALTAALEGVLVRLRPRLPLVHAAMFVALAAMLSAPLLAPEPAAERLAGIARDLIWAVWFPLVFLSVLATGRSWCGLMCPMGAASEWANRVGLRRAIPRWVQWPGTPVLSFVVVTVWGQTVGVRDHPEALALVFGSLFALAVGLGFVYGRNKRAWCRHMCPIGLLLGVYARLGAVGFEPKRPAAGGDRWTERGVCPTMIDLGRKTEARHCIECLRCVSPRAPGGLYLELRRPGLELEQVRRRNANLAEVLFLFLGTGVALGGFLWLVLPSYQSLRLALGNLAIDQGWYWLGEAGPGWLMSVHPDRREVFRWLDFLLISGYMLAWAVGIAALLGTATAAMSGLAGRFGGAGSFGARFIELGYQFAPVAMMSLLIGLGGGLLRLLESFGLTRADTAALAIAGLALGCAWSLWLGWRLLAAQAVAPRLRPLALIPGALASLGVAAAWFPAVTAV